MKCSHVPLLMMAGGTGVFVSYQHAENCASHRRGWFGRKKPCDCGAPPSYVAEDEESIRAVTRFVLSGGEGPPPRQQLDMEFVAQRRRRKVRP
jgi:hypothetical protein